MFSIVKIENTWNRYGDRVNVRETIIEETNDPIVAGKALAGQNSKLWGAAHAVSIEVRRTAIRVDMIELYAEVIGEEKFQAQLSDETFSINLDDFFKAL